MTQRFSSTTKPVLSKILLGLAVLIGLQAAVCQPASAQRLFERMRARIEARRLPQPPQPAGVQQPGLQQPGVPAPGQSPRPDGLSPATGDEDASPRFGIDVSPDRVGADQGLRVLAFSENSPAESAGLRVGDLIVSIGNQRVATLEDAARLQRELSPGQSASVQFLRDGRSYQVRVQTASSESPDDDPDTDSLEPNAAARQASKPPVPGRANGPTLARPKASFGLSARSASPQRGVLVVKVDDGSTAEIAGIRAGDRIVAADGRLVRDLDDLIREISLKNPGEKVIVGVVRDESMIEIETELGGPGGTPIRAATAKPAVAELPAVAEMPTPKPPTPEADALPAPKPDDPKPDAPKPDAAQLPAPRQPASDPLALPDDDAASDDSLPPPMKPEAEPSEAQQSELERLRAEVARLKAQLEQN